jgi:hypothetical protein
MMPHNLFIITDMQQNSNHYRRRQSIEDSRVQQGLHRGNAQELQAKAGHKTDHDHDIKRFGLVEFLVQPFRKVEGLRQDVGQTAGQYRYSQKAGTDHANREQ